MRIRCEDSADCDQIIRNDQMQSRSKLEIQTMEGITVYTGGEFGEDGQWTPPTVLTIEKRKAERSRPITGSSCNKYTAPGSSRSCLAPSKGNYRRQTLRERKLWF